MTVHICLVVICCLPLLLLLQYVVACCGQTNLHVMLGELGQEANPDVQIGVVASHNAQHRPHVLAASALGATWVHGMVHIGPAGDDAFEWKR